MLPLHSGHDGPQSVPVLAFALVVVAAAFALTRDGWTRVVSLLAVGLGTLGARLAVWVIGVHGDAGLLLGDGLELSALVVLALAGYYGILDVRAARSVDG